MVKKYPDSDVPFGSSWAESRDLKPVDTLLRKYGFRIHSRPRKGPTTWSKDGKVLTQEEALMTLPINEVAAARGTDVLSITLSKKYKPN